MANQGAKKRKEENARHMANLRRIIIACNVIYVLVRMVAFHSSFTWKHWIGLILTSVAYLIPYQQLARMAQPAYADDGELLDGGFDMSTGGVCGYLHDVIYITSFVQVMSIISGKFWFTYLVQPPRHSKPQFCSILTSHLDQHESPLVKQASTDRDTQLTIQPQGTTHLAVNRQEHQKTPTGGVGSSWTATEIAVERFPSPCAALVCTYFTERAKNLMKEAGVHLREKEPCNRDSMREEGYDGAASQPETQKESLVDEQDSQKQPG